MEERDLQLIQKHLGDNEMLATLYREHVDFERQLEKYDSKPYLTPLDEVERKNLQKRKLLGRDAIERILQEIRDRELMS